MIAEPPSSGAVQLAVTLVALGADTEGADGAAGTVAGGGGVVPMPKSEYGPAPNAFAALTCTS